MVKGQGTFTACYSLGSKHIFIQQLVISGSDATLAVANPWCHVAFIMFFKNSSKKGAPYLVNSFLIHQQVKVNLLILIR